MNSNCLKCTASLALAGLMIFSPAVPAKETEKKAAIKLDSKADLEALGAKLKAAVKSGKMTEKEATAKYREFAGKGGKKMAGKGKMMKGRSDSFYSIVIGRLKSKDIELGEFSLEVDHVTSIYGNAKRKDEIIGKTVNVVGVSGAWLDKLLLIKRGQTLKLRSGTLHGKTISLSPKATVLERALPFDPEVYPVPPTAFRGFRGVVSGKIEEKSDSGYELILRVAKVERTTDGNRAAEPESVTGRLVSVRGFFDNKYRSAFQDLRLGDNVQLGLSHAVPQGDELNVAGELKKL